MSPHEDADQSMGLLEEGDGRETDQPVKTSASRWHGGTFARHVITCLVLCLAGWGAFDALRRLVSLIPGNPPCWCGTSDTEAIALGCKYDHISVDWLPEHCIDQELVDEFDKSGPGENGSWPYYLRNETVASKPYYRIDDWTEIDEFAKNGVEYYSTIEWHLAHCLFVWRKQQRASWSGVTIEPWNNKEQHVHHCSKYVMDVVNSGAPVNAITTIIFGWDRHTPGYLDRHPQI